MIRLDPTVKQANALARAAGVSRFTYNWALAEWKLQYANGDKPSAAALKKQWNAIKAEQFPWVLESPRDANSQPFADLNRAFSNFFKSCKGQRKGRRVGYPSFRKRGIDDSFYVANDKFELRSRGKRGAVRLPVIGNVKTFEKFRFQGKILSGRVFRKAGQWFLAVACETQVVQPTQFKNEVVGVDLGLKTAVVTSRGEFFSGPKPLRATLKKLRRANQKLHRRKKSGCNRKKAQHQVARIHQRIANIRKDFLHKVTSKICRENQTVVIEDLNVAGMLRNEKLARAISDVGMGTFRTFCEYKAAGRVVIADRWFPSSKRCSGCGNVKTEFPLSERTYHCESCGLIIDRDLNASKNLEQYPRLEGNWRRVSQTPTETVVSTRKTKVRRASAVVEVGTKPEDSHVLTN